MPRFRCCLLLVLFVPAVMRADEPSKAPVTIFVARKIVTMERRQPFVTAVGVAKGAVVAVGTLDEVEQATKGRQVTIDRTFADKVLLPGFVAHVELGQDADLGKVRSALRQGGVTTVADVSGRTLNAKDVAPFDADEVPFRTLLLGGKGSRVASLDAVVTTPADVNREDWEAGRRLVVRGTIDDALDALAQLQKHRAKDDHRFTVAASQKWSVAQCERLAKLGGVAAVDPREASRAGSLLKNRVPLALTSRSSVPAAPLLLVSALSGSEDKVTVLTALRAVTIDAAFVLRKENQIGSVAPGKKADFTVLDQDPLAVSLEQLKDVPVWGTVFEGKKHPLGQAAGWNDRPKRLATQSGTPARHLGLLGDDLDPRRGGKCDPSCPCRGGPRSKTLPLQQGDPRRGR